MDTSAVIQLSCQAAESVLRFRALGFTRRPMIDLQSFRAAITTQIEKVARDHRHRFEIPLAEVVTYAGVGAARAAQQWNDISHKENHVVTEWFRNCVCNLVSGVVNDIGQMAFEDQGMNACMYLEPDDYDPFDVPSYTTVAPVHKSSSYIPSRRDDYYGFQEAEVQQNEQSSPVSGTQWTTFHPASTVSQSLPLRHEVTEGYAALQRLAASHNDTSARADFIQSTKRLREDPEPIDADAQETLLKRPTKRARQDTLPSRPSPVSAGQAVTARDTANKAQRNVRWTEEEINILLTARDFGQTWSEIDSMLPRHTDMACRTKYRVEKDKEARIQPRADVDASAAGDSGQGDEHQVFEKDMDAGQGHGKEDQTRANADSLEAVEMASMGIDGHDNQDSGVSSMATWGSSNAEPEEDDGGNPAHDPTIEDKE